ncbi:GumC family protein [Euzebyella saccharophila]|uniref:non-specific protein-tyrosine kinase n=1 Tax=Euzebyella saccharophila TaxID=679664 RepID=A0ABV8JVS8_9FLAO|nr:tyrosine-protein kinase [Euzebyella saccharophila]
MEKQDKNIMKILSGYLRYWPLFLLGVIVCVMGVLLYLRYWAVTEYKIASTILVKNNEEGQGSIQAEGIKGLGLLKSNYNVDDEIGIITSSGLLEKVIENRELNVNYYIEGSIKDVEIYGDDIPFKVLVDKTTADVLYDQPYFIKPVDENSFEIKLELEDGGFEEVFSFGDLVQTPFATFTVSKNPIITSDWSKEPWYFVIRDTDVLIEEMLNNLTVTRIYDDGELLELSFVSNDKNKGEDILSGIIETYVEEKIKYENELAETTIRMIDERIKVLSGEITGVEKSVEEFKTKNQITDVGSNASSFIEQANDYKRMITDYQTQINVMESLESYLSNGNTDSPIPGALSSSDPALVGIIGQYNETLLEKKQLAQSASSSNPMILNLERTLTELRNSILDNVRSAKNGLIIARRNIQANANKYDAQIAKVPGMERELLDISRQQSTKEALYLYLLQKREEEVLSLAAPVSSTRIVSLPKAGRFPVAPNKTALYLGGFLLGLFIPFSIIYAKEILSNKVTSVEELETLVSAPVLGEISKNSKKGLIDFSQESRTPTAELFQLLRFNLEYFNKIDKNQVVLVTSSIKGEGKTFIASNLAATLAFNGEKVAVLSFDLREPHLIENLMMDKRSPGITDFILNREYEVDDIVHKHKTIENLYVIPPGELVQYVGRLMISEKVGQLISHLRNEFDRIIIDTPPVGLISDAYALNKFIDSTLYVVRKDITEKDHLKILERIYRSNKLNNPLLLLNGTEIGNSYGYEVK